MALRARIVPMAELSTNRQCKPEGSLMRHAGKHIERLYKSQLCRFRRTLSNAAIPHRPGRRVWGIDLSQKAVESIQAGSLQYSYRGIPMLKNPFEVALYPLLFWQVKPRTVIEIGSYLGGSALWLADLMRNCDINGTVISIDIKTPAPPERRNNVRFLKGDANALDAVLSPAFLARLDRPLVVVEDSTHAAETTLAVLEFFGPVLRSGEYIVIEDGVVSDLGRAHHFNGGPGLAISLFLSGHPEFEIDAGFCDRYGHNFTGNPNGYLRRL
jgi:cephalosporin hydroxylase